MSDATILTWPNGSYMYLQNYMVHRPCKEGPAYYHVNGSFVYSEYGRNHRPLTLGPAAYDATTGVYSYWVEGVHLWDEKSITSTDAQE